MTKHDILCEHGDLIDQLDAADNDERLSMSYFDGLETPLNVAARVRRLVSLAAALVNENTRTRSGRTLRSTARVTESTSRVVLPEPAQAANQPFFVWFAVDDREIFCCSQDSNIATSWWPVDRLAW